MKLQKNATMDDFLLISVVPSVIKSEPREYDFLLSLFQLILVLKLIFLLFLLGYIKKYNIQNYSLICPCDAEAIESDW